MPFIAIQDAVADWLRFSLTKEEGQVQEVGSLRACKTVGSMLEV